MLHKYTLIILSSFFLFACNSGKARLEKGQYDLAVYQAVKRLQQKPNHKKASKVLQEAYTHAVEFHMANIETFDLSANGSKWEQMAYEYEMIDYLNSAIRKYPDYRSLVSLVDVKSELALSRLEASKEHMSRGLLFLNKGDKESARLAYDEFSRADYFNPGNETILDKLFEAREAGTVNIAIEFPSNEVNDYLIPTKDLYYEIQQFASHLNFNFLRVVSQDNPYYDVDEILQLQFDQLFIGNVYVDRVQEHIVKEGVLIGTTQINDSTVADVYGTVSADLRSYVKTIESSGSLLMQRIDSKTGAVIHRSRFPASYNWVSEWAEFNGDSRALSEKQIKMAKNSEPPPPSFQWLFGQLSRPMFSGVTQQFERQYAYLR